MCWELGTPGARRHVVAPPSKFTGVVQSANHMPYLCQRSSELFGCDHPQRTTRSKHTYHHHHHHHHHYYYCTTTTTTTTTTATATATTTTSPSYFFQCMTLIQLTTTTATSKG
ncbi:hypothetical protein VTO42DRAFT_8459 [Malbranchea cinnamomea]